MRRIESMNILILLGTCCAFFWGCSDTNTRPDAGFAFDRAGLLASLGERVALGTYRDFVDRANALSAATTEHASAGGSDAAKRQAAQDAWRQAMALWQRAEMMSWGPAGPTSITGGSGLRDEIYSWPTVDPCRVDQVLVEKGYDESGFFDDALVNAFGLDALEYLLFVQGDSNACGSQHEINQGPWDALGTSEIAIRRANYAKRLGAQIAALAVELRDAWEQGGSDFLTRFAQAGESGSPYDSAQEAIDEVFAAMYYIELRTKDAKLATPAGINGVCATDVCPDQLESRWAGHSLENVIGNLEGVQLLFSGGPAAAAPGEPKGFSAYLRAAQAESLAVQMEGDLDAALASAQNLTGPMRDLLANDRSKVVALHDSIKAFTDQLKSQFVTLLNLKIPDEGAGDND